MKHLGKCHLCGEETELTFEHIPPQKANNNNSAHAIVGDTLIEHICSTKQPWDLSELKYKNMQRGMGGYTLCERCNNNTGTWYAKDYIKFSNEIGYVLTNKVNLEKAKSLKVEIKNMYPLRIFKQILCMFMSTMQENFLDIYPDLREFILNKESRNFNVKKYRVSMYFLKEPQNSWTGINGVLYNDVKIKTMAGMDIYPLGFILEIDPTEEKIDYVTDISNLGTDYTYDDNGTLVITSNILERNTIFIGDFRSKEKIIKQSEKSRENLLEEYKVRIEKLNIEEEKYKNIFEDYKLNKISSADFINKMEKLLH